MRAHPLLVRRSRPFWNTDPSWGLILVSHKTLQWYHNTMSYHCFLVAQKSPPPSPGSLLRKMGRTYLNVDTLLVGRGSTICWREVGLQAYLGFVLAPYQIAAFFTCLVTLPFASSCETACSMLWFIHVIMSVNTHLRRRIFMAVLHNAAEQIPDRLATRPPVRETVGPRPTNTLPHYWSVWHS